MSAEPGTGRDTTSELMADRAYAALRDRIVALRIAPGAPINEDALGRELEMGRTPVREAIKRLALERLVTVYPRRGTFASEINITDLAAISDVRVQLEGHAARRAAERLTPDQREQLAGDHDGGVGTFIDHWPEDRYISPEWPGGLTRSSSARASSGRQPRSSCASAATRP